MKRFLYFTLITLIFSCNQNAQDSTSIEEKNTEIDVQTYKFVNNIRENLDSLAYLNLLTDVSTYMLRKPDAATWKTKFNPEFRSYFQEKSNELEWLADLKLNDTLFVFFIRDGRDNNGKSNRGVGVKLSLENNKISYFEELFVSKITDRLNLESLGERFLESAQNKTSIASFVEQNRGAIDWPDGRLFYSVEKSEWRYVE